MKGVPWKANKNFSVKNHVNQKPTCEGKTTLPPRERERESFSTLLSLHQTRGIRNITCVIDPSRLRGFTLEEKLNVELCFVIVIDSSHEMKIDATCCWPGGHACCFFSDSRCHIRNCFLLMDVDGMIGSNHVNKFISKIDLNADIKMNLDEGSLMQAKERHEKLF